MEEKEDKYDIKIIESMEEFERMCTSWNKLLRQSISDTIFLTWEWLYTWAEHYIVEGRKLFIIAVYTKDDLIGIAPFYINPIKSSFFKIRQIEFLGSPETASDYLDILVQRGKEKEIAKYLYDFLFLKVSSKWDSILLRDIPSESLFLLYFLRDVKKNRKYFELQDGSFCPFLKLPESNEQFILTLSPNRRKRLKYDLNTLKKQGEINFYTIQSMDCESHFKKFFTLYEKRWKNINSKFYLFLEKFVLKGAKEGWVCIDFFNFNGYDTAGLFFLRYQNRLSMYLMAVDTSLNKKISVGNILVGLSVEKAINDRVSVYDFLKGDEEYKFYWTDEGKKCLDVFTCKMSFGTISLILKKSAKNFAKVIMPHLLHSK